jgi:hypothetical protein
MLLSAALSPTGSPTGLSSFTSALARRGDRRKGRAIRAGGDAMSDDLTDTQVELLCEIEEYDPLQLTADRKRDLERLLFEGYVAPAAAHPGSKFMVTAKGMEFLGERGAGLNEG